jgi:site-specific DNA recombinase
MMVIRVLILIVSVMKKWNHEMVNTILKNENYTGTLLQGKRRKLNYRVNKQIQLEKENWIITPNHHKAIISKEKFDKVQDILNRQAKVNKDGSIGILSGFLKCKCCGSNMIKRTSKGKVYYYCSNYYRNKTCENNKSISENGLIEIINEKLNLINITRLELENKVKCIYIDKYKYVKIDFK